MPAAHTPGAHAGRGAQWEVFGTLAALRLSDPDAAIEPALSAVTSELEAIDRACSRFRADSELSHVNANAGRATAAGPLLIEALAVALRAAELSDGDVDPALGTALELAGYDRDWRLLESPREQDEDSPPTPLRVRARLRPGWRAVRLDRVRATIAMPRGVKLDLGASAKAWAADRGAATASAASGCGALLSLGGDIATSGPAPAGGWRVHVTDDHRSDASAPGQTIVIHSGGLATSSTAVRRWRHEGRTMHHLIDPATGAPVLDSWRTVSVAAVDCADANTATTAALVRAAGAIDWLDSLALPARLVAWDGAVTTLGGWPAQQTPAPAPRPARRPGARAPRADAARTAVAR